MLMCIYRDIFTNSKFVDWVFCISWYEYITDRSGIVTYITVIWVDCWHGNGEWLIDKIIDDCLKSECFLSWCSITYVGPLVLLRWLTIFKELWIVDCNIKDNEGIDNKQDSNDLNFRFTTATSTFYVDITQTLRERLGRKIDRRWLVGKINRGRLVVLLIFIFRKLKENMN